MRAPLLLVLLIPALSACDQLSAVLEIPNPQKEEAAAEAEGKAIGSACRQSGRSLEDCYLLNATAKKTHIFAGWKEMNDYMLANEIPVVPSKIAQPGELSIWPRPAPGIPPLPDIAPNPGEASSPGSGTSGRTL